MVAPKHILVELQPTAIIIITRKPTATMVISQVWQTRLVAAAAAASTVGYTRQEPLKVA